MEVEMTICMHCQNQVDPNDPEVYKQVTVWIGGEKSNLSIGRTYTGNLACKACVASLKEGQEPGTEDLFAMVGEVDDTEPSVQGREWHKGFEAGWRGDELIGELKDYHTWYASGYEAGRAAHEGAHVNRREEESYWQPMLPLGGGA